jgi:hypothetical protein
MTTENALELVKCDVCGKLIEALNQPEFCNNGVDCPFYNEDNFGSNIHEGPGKMYSGSEVADMMKASYKAGCRVDLKKLQSVLHNVQQVMAGYSQDDTWSDYDRKSHSELIEMQYIIEDEINKNKK